ncbi:Ger(x)C family spore germination protein [Sporomusa silvacetica]
MKSKLTIVFSAFVLLNVFIGGCRDMNNVDELAIVLGVGIDRVRGTEPILLTVQIVNTSAKGPGGEGGGQDTQFITLTSQGKSLLDAERNLAKTSSRKVFFSHNKIVVLGKNFTASDISEAMDYIQRNREFRRTNLIVVAEQTAKEVLETKLDMEKLPMLGLHDMLVSKNQLFIYPVNINDFLLNLKTDIGISYASVVNLLDVTKENKIKQDQVAEKSGESSGTKGSTKIHLDKIAIFKNNRLVGTLTEQESIGFLWLINKLKRDTVVIPFPIAEEEKGISLDIIKGNSKIIPHITDKGITMEVVCTGEAELREAGYLSEQLKDLQIYKQLEQEAEKVLKAKVEQTIVRAQQDLKADFIGFGNQIHNYNPTEWHLIKADWEQRFPKIQYTITCHVTMRKAGIIKGSATLRNDEE